VLLALAALAVIACGGDSSSDPAGGAGPAQFQANARESDCEDWKQLSTEERLSVIGGITGEFGAPVREGRPVTLPDKQAYDLFERYCEQPYAKRFKLYKLYIRAAAFQRYGEALRRAD
jgi:hypothetical protein